MLQELERKLTALVGDALATRPQVEVTQAVGEPPAPADGRGAVAVGLAALSSAPVFAPDVVVVDPPAPAGAASRRVMPVGFEASLALARRSADSQAASLTQARTLLLEDVSVVAHALAADEITAGTAFATPTADRGYAVLAFGLATGSFDAALEGQTLRGSLRYAGHAVIWPPGITAPEGTIEAVDPLLEALPLAIAADDRVVPGGGSTTVRIRSITGGRLSADGSRTAPQLALSVVSDLPPADRGAIASGTAGPETGLRLVQAAAETAVAYQAPVGDLGATRSELVAIHLARADGTRGMLLGSVAIMLAPGGP